jgi:DNA-binding beta-propeller fold protein YncE
MKKMLFSFLIAIAIFSLTGCGGGSGGDSGGGSTPPPPSGDIWSFYYYADPDANFNRIVVMDPKGMTMVGEIPVVGRKPHSVDRAGTTNKMYVRTTGGHSFDVLDASNRTYIKTVPLQHTPRAIGSYNKFRNLQLITGKDFPMVSVVDVATDEVVAVAGPAKGGTPSGNCGGNATGHSIWIDKDHFTIIDRINDQLVTYRIDGDGSGIYSLTKTQTFDVPTGVHAIDVDVFDTNLEKYTFYAAIEGSMSKNIKPQILELHYDHHGKFMRGRTVTFPGTDSHSMMHHYSLAPNKQDIWVPMCDDKKVYVVDKRNMRIKATYPAGWGAGHVNFSAPLGLAIVTNHFDNKVTIIDMNTGGVDWVQISEQAGGGGEMGSSPLLQSHVNWVSPDGKFFYLFATHDGIFVEIDLTTRKVSRTYYTGGTPEQSSS